MKQYVPKPPPIPPPHNQDPHTFFTPTQLAVMMVEFDRNINFYIATRLGQNPAYYSNDWKNDLFWHFANIVMLSILFPHLYRF